VRINATPSTISSLCGHYHTKQITQWHIQPHDASTSGVDGAQIFRAISWKPEWTPLHLLLDQHTVRTGGSVSEPLQFLNIEIGSFHDERHKTIRACLGRAEPKRPPHERFPTFFLLRLYNVHTHPNMPISIKHNPKSTNTI
jgi:hypothetical protein